MTIITPIATESTATCRIVAVEVRNVYGVKKAYPANETARLFADMVGRKTLTRRDIEYCRDLGYSIFSAADADWSDVA